MRDKFPALVPREAAFSTVHISGMTHFQRPFLCHSSRAGQGEAVISRHPDEGPVLSSVHKEPRLGKAGANVLVLSEGWVYERNRFLED